METMPDDKAQNPNDKKGSTNRSGGVYLRLGLTGAGTSPAPPDVAACHCEGLSPFVIARLAKPAEAISGAARLPRTVRVLATTHFLRHCEGQKARSNLCGVRGLA
jgi:hypothetical protein